LLPGGTIKNVHVVARAARDESGKLVEFFGAMMDVTAQNCVQKALESALQEMCALKDRFQLAIAANANNAPAQGDLRDEWQRASPSRWPDLA
jgi:hypothetical protein